MSRNKKIYDIIPFEALGLVCTFVFCFLSCLQSLKLLNGTSDRTTPPGQLASDNASAQTPVYMCLLKSDQSSFEWS